MESGGANGAWRRGLSLLAVGLVLWLGLPAGAGAPVGPAPAFADDDGDGDGDGDGDDGSGFGGGFGGGGIGGAASPGAGAGGSEGTARSRVPPGGTVRGLFRDFRSNFDRRPARARPARRSGGGGGSRRAAPAPEPPPPSEAAAEIVALGVGDAEVAALVAAGYAVLARASVALAGADVVRLAVPAGTTLADARDAVAALAPAATVDFNHFYRPGTGEDGPGEDPLAGCEGLHCVAPRLVAWPRMPGTGGTCAAGLSIGIVDTGINGEHEALSAGRIVVHALDPPDEGARASGRQHGTAVAAILLGGAESRSPGLLPDAHLVAVDAFHRTARGDERADAFALVRALDILAAEDVVAIGLALSGPQNRLVTDMTGRLAAAGVVLVAAAGNAGPRASPAFPAADAGVIAVTAVDRNGSVYRRAGQGPHIDIAAPGVEVWTAASVRGARWKTGTSFAVPFVLAAAALLKGADGEIDHARALAALSATARDLGEPGRDPTYGAGLLQAARLCDPPAVDDGPPA